jgi:hypothetical protein
MVESIEVLAEAVHSVVAVEDSIRVEHRNDHKVELRSELNSLRAITDKEVN